MKKEQLLELGLTEEQADKVLNLHKEVLAGFIPKARFDDFHSHRLRHTLATRLLAQGTPIDVVQEVLGHENINTTRRYAKTAPERLCQLAPKIEQK